MLNSIAKNAQTVATNQNVLFTETRVKSRRCACNTGWLAHDNGSGLLKSQTVEICRWRSKLSLMEMLHQLQQAQ